MMFWKKKQKVEEVKKQPSMLDIDFNFVGHQLDAKMEDELRKNLANTFQKKITDFPIKHQVLLPDGKMATMDADKLQQAKVLSNVGNQGGYGGGMSPVQLNFFAGQGFIGFQICAILAQNWLINKACTVPARDAVRNGYKLTVNEGEERGEELNKLREMDKKYKINEHMIDFIRKGRIFGIRIAMYNYDGVDYEKPFNINGIKKGAYKGITQIDPYWITPELDINSASNPGSQNFYKPTWWRINNQRIHFSHLCIFIPNAIPDVLKPTYIYGGPSIPQLIFNRVYSAEKCANESPQLLLTKRLFIQKMNLAAALADQVKLEETMAFFTNYMNNFGTRLINNDEEINKLETSLTDVDETIMTQYQLVASASNVPANKLLGTTPKGFNSTGEYEEATYHEELESIQTNDLTPFLDRHHELCIKSEIAPNAPFEVTVEWEALDAMTAVEKGKLRKMNADADKVYIDAGAIDQEDLRKKIIADPESGFNGLDDESEDDEDEVLGNSEQLDNPQADKTIQQLSLNGPQILAISQILGEIVSKQIPAESAKALMAISFTTLTPEQIDALVDPMAKVKPQEQPEMPNPDEQAAQITNAAKA